ncbi:MAG TPA: T9SS type A sorting domain-containing protein [Bacteroidia bacterium]
MKKQLLSVFSLLMVSVAFSQTIPNGGFENWTTTSYEEPAYYMTSNSNNNNGVVNPGNAIKTTDAYHGTYAIRLTTIQSGVDTVMAFFSNGDPGKNPPQGGIPYSHKPTGMRLYYKSNIIGTDTAIILVEFKKAGVSIGSYFYKISATHSSYTLFNPTFSPALTVTPDSIVIAAASSNAFTKRGNPGNMLQIDSVSFTGVTAQPANLNGDFELWQLKTNTMANGWATNYGNQTTDKYTGTYALELQTSAPGPMSGGGGIQSGQATTGKWSNSGPNQGGLPYTQQIDTLVFYYKYLPADPNDSASVYVNFKYNGIQFQNMGTFLLQASTYTKVMIPFDLTHSCCTPDTAIIGMSSSRRWPAPTSYIGSDLKIDNMYFISQKKPVSNFIAPATGCVGVPIQLTDISSNMVTSWNWITGGGSPPSATAENPIVTYNSIGTHTITMNATNSFGTGPNSIKTITIYALPSVVATSPTICEGSPATLTASGASTYTWSTSATTTSISVSPTVTTAYTVTGTDVNGCSNSDIEFVTVLTPPTPSICMVTTDAPSLNNIMYWDKTSYTNVDSFIIYREVTTGLYKRIGGQAFSDTSQFVDTARSIGPANGNPNGGSYRYKLQTVDNCHNYSALSPYHNTVYITNNGLGQFSWATPYSIEGQGNPVTNYVLFCDAANTNTWTNVSTVAGTQNSATDPGYTSHSNIANWRVDALGFNCNPTARLSGNNGTMAAKVKSHSNQNNNRTTGINKTSGSNQVTVYPNPAATVLNISFSNTPSSKVSIKVISILGSEVYNSNQPILSGNSLSLDISKYESGTYLVQITTDNFTETKRIVKQ